MTSSDPSLTHLTCSDREEDDMEETSSSSATPSEALSPQDEKDARDHLTPTALVHAATGVVVHNAIDLDLETGDEEATVDKLLASVPPSLERQTALPSQPGAFRAGGDAEQDEEDATTFGGDRTAPPLAGLIEATLVEETAVVSPPPVAPIYKGEIVLPEGDDAEGSSREKANVVTLSKKQVRCFLLAFCSLCFVAIVLSVVLSFVELNGDGDFDKDASNTTTPAEKTQDLNDIPESYWYEDKPQELWEMLQDRPYITHHVALVSIVNPQMTVITGDASPLQCSSLQDDDMDWDDARRRSLRRDDDENVVMVSFTCGSEQSMPPSWIHGDPQPDAVLVMHDGSAEILNGGNRSITCRDAKFFPNDTLKYNQVFCSIPHDDAQLNGRVLSFFFSCFSRTPPVPVAAVQTPNLSATCRGGDGEDLPPVLVTAPAAVLLSTQRLCRVSEEIVLQNSIVAEDWRNRSQNCSTGWRDEDVCLSQTLRANHTVPRTAWSVCFASPDGTQPCVEVRLPNVTIDDQLRYDVRECAPASLQESLLMQSDDGLPFLRPLDNATLEELRAAIRKQEFWVDEFLLPLSR